MEAALLMGILLPVLAAVIYMGFFLHDRSFLQGAAYEAAVYISLHAEENADAAGAASRLVQGRTLGVRDPAASVEVGERQVSVAYSGSFCSPAVPGGFAGRTVRSAVTLSLERPSRRIQKIRGAAKVVQSIRRIRT